MADDPAITKDDQGVKLKHIPYATQWIDQDDIGAVDLALGSEYLTQGPKVAEFEQKMAGSLEARYAVAFSSGTAALHAACFAAGIGPGDEAITSPITFAASANCVLYCGGKPVFADVDKATVNIDPAQIAGAITAKTKAIIPVHFTGNPVDLKEINLLAKEHGLTVIEDAAHALGAGYDGKPIGACACSDLTCFSFHAVKHITTGEGGMVLTNNKLFYDQLMMFRTHGITRAAEALVNKNEGGWYYEMHHLGFNYRLTDFQAALGIKQLEKLGRFVARRRAIVARYGQALTELPGLRTIKVKPGRTSAWHIYPIIVSARRKEIFEQLRSEGLGVNVHYLPVYLHPYYRQLGYRPGLCPNAEEYYRGALTLPLYPKMSDDDVETVIAAVKAAVRDLAV
jgi:perosamine synthetase